MLEYKERFLISYEILFEDNDILAVNKLAPMPVLPDKTKDLDLQTLLQREHASCQKFLEAVHRIDRRTSGIVVFAKSPRALRILDIAFKNRAIHKTYLACLEKEPIPAAGILKHSIVFDTKRNISIAISYDSVEAARKRLPANTQLLDAELTYTMVYKSDRYFFVTATPRTGRHHQIRAQFAAMGWPIKGDLKYGARRSTQSGLLMLHAWKIEIPHPVSHELLTLSARFPTSEKLWTIFDQNTTNN